MGCIVDRSIDLSIYRPILMNPIRSIIDPGLPHHNPKGEKCVMNRLMLSVLVLAAAAACSQTPTEPTYTVPLTASTTSLGRGTPLASTHLAGHEEVPARDTVAQGQAILKVSEDGLSISYKLIVANIENVVQAHIHTGALGANGPVVAFLAGPFASGGGRVNGVLAEGTITAANLIGPLLGQPLSALLTQMENGTTYVNVHTNDGVAPIDTGPGDFPGGEVRGQIKKK
jgi:hypothetical protein